VDLLGRAIDKDDAELAAVAIAAQEHAVHAGEVSQRLFELAGETDGTLRSILRTLYREHGLHAPEEYGDRALHCIDVVLERRAGSPVVLAVILIGVARRAGIALEPIAFPGHFLVRGPSGLIDPCTGAMPLPEAELLALARHELGAAFRIERASAREVAVRILENLQRAHEEHGDRGRVLALAETLHALGGPSPEALRAARSLVRARSEGRALTVDRRGLSFRVGDGPEVDLSRRRALPLLLVRLVEHHRSGASHGLGWPALVDAGWPGEKMLPDAAWARLRTAIRTLRKLGLEDVLLTIGSGYLLDPSCEVRWR
jgi:regulator of sirC expression with transglutaminase-like and TPR domain